MSVEVDLELRELMAFIAVAESGTFTAAAARVGSSQPAVSRAITRLERRIGVRVLDRSTHHVALTNAGSILLVQARAVLAAAESAVRLTRRSQDVPALVVAVKADGDAGLLPAILERYEQAAGLLPVRLTFADTHALPSAVRNGIADVALVAGPLDAAGLEVELLREEPRVVVLAADHPSSAANRLTVEELAAAPVLSWPGLPSRIDRYYRGLDEFPCPDDPPAGPPVADLAEALRLVEMGRGATFLPLSVADRFRRDGLVTRPVDGLAGSTAVLLWRAGSRDRSVAAFVRAGIDASSSRELKLTDLA